VLAGVVHYSFVNDVTLRPRGRPRRDGPRIWQVCSSGLANSFPPRLLPLLDRLNRWLHSPRSPLNRLTRWRAMRVTPRKPEGTPHRRRLLNGCGVGLVALDALGRPWRIHRWLAGSGEECFTERACKAREA
jgi:hypothetical protein